MKHSVTVKNGSLGITATHLLNKLILRLHKRLDNFPMRHCDSFNGPVVIAALFSLGLDLEIKMSNYQIDG